jgi:hypothetical protein
VGERQMQVQVGHRVATGVGREGEEEEARRAGGRQKREASVCGWVGVAVCSPKQETGNSKRARPRGRRSSAVREETSK